MKIKNIFQLAILASFFTVFSACGDDSSSSASDEDSSSSVASFKSSSSLSTRADIDYKDTVSLGDTMRIYLELFKGDSSKMDESETYLDSDAVRRSTQAHSTSKTKKSASRVNSAKRFRLSTPPRKTRPEKTPSIEPNSFLVSEKTPPLPLETRTHSSISATIITS